jgi:predicted O-methyltransferase YrrM
VAQVARGAIDDRNGVAGRMDERLTAYLEDLHRRGSAHDAEKVDRLERLRNVEPDTARLLAVLVRATGARRVLELGTSNGYSTLWLADAARSVGGRIVSVDLAAARTAEAKEHLERVQLEEQVELRTGDAALALSGSGDASWEMIFLDAERPAYAGYWPDLLRVLVPGGLLVVDNVLSHAGELNEFRELVSGEPGVTEAVVPTGAGALLVVRDI